VQSLYLEVPWSIKMYQVMNNHDQLPQWTVSKSGSQFSQFSNISEKAGSNKKTLEQQQVAGPGCSNVSHIQPNRDPGDHRMANTISISPKPGIKCYARDNKLCNTLFNNTAKTSLEKIKKLPDKEWL
jgi:hypothetical protein